MLTINRYNVSGLMRGRLLPTRRHVFLQRLNVTRHLLGPILVRGIGSARVVDLVGNHDPNLIP